MEGDRAGDPVFRCGSLYRITLQGLLFPAHSMTHCSTGWSLTDRIMLTAYYCISNARRLTAEQRALLGSLDFGLPK